MAMRIILIAAFVIAAMSLDARPVKAYETPWCAMISLGLGNVYWDCRYNSLEECVPNVIAGNRGFCNPNPLWEGPYAAARPRYGKRRVRAR